MEVLEPIFDVVVLVSGKELGQRGMVDYIFKVQVPPCQYFVVRCHGDCVFFFICLSFLVVTGQEIEESLNSR